MSDSETSRDRVTLLEGIVQSVKDAEGSEGAWDSYRIGAQRHEPLTPIEIRQHVEILTDCHPFDERLVHGVSTRMQSIGEILAHIGGEARGWKRQKNQAD